MTSLTILVIVICSAMLVPLVLVATYLVRTRLHLDGHDDRAGWAHVEHVREVQERSATETRQLMEQIDRLGRGGR